MSAPNELGHVLGKVFDDARTELRHELNHSDYERRKRDFVFHMTDWQSDLEQLINFFERPDRLTEEAASSLVIGFLYHVVPHLNAAGRLLLDRISDPFGPQNEKSDPEPPGPHASDS
jgi:hypothetical protein